MAQFTVNTAAVQAVTSGKKLVTLKVALKVLAACNVQLADQFVRNLGKVGTIATEQVMPEYADKAVTVYNVQSIVTYANNRHTGNVRTQAHGVGTLYSVRLTTEQFAALPEQVQQLLKPASSATPEQKAKRKAYNKARQLKLKQAKQAAQAAKAEAERKAAQAANTPNT